MGRVTRINTRQASVEIICVGETVLREPHRGIIRKEVCVASTYVYTPYITLNVSRFPLACVWSKGDYSVRVLLYPPGSWYCQNTGKPCAWCTYIYIYISCIRMYVYQVQVRVGSGGSAGNSFRLKAGRTARSGAGSTYTQSHI